MNSCLHPHDLPRAVSVRHGMKPDTAWLQRPLTRDTTTRGSWPRCESSSVTTAWSRSGSGAPPGRRRAAGHNPAGDSTVTPVLVSRLGPPHARTLHRRPVRRAGRCGDTGGEDTTGNVREAALASIFLTSIVGAGTYATLALITPGDIAPVRGLGLLCVLCGLVGGYLGARLQPHMPETGLRFRSTPSPPGSPSSADPSQDRLGSAPELRNTGPGHRRAAQHLARRRLVQHPRLPLRRRGPAPGGRRPNRSSRSAGPPVETSQHAAARRWELRIVVEPRAPRSDRVMKRRSAYAAAPCPMAKSPTNVLRFANYRAQSQPSVTVVTSWRVCGR
jgi:hypothetical protein